MLQLASRVPYPALTLWFSDMRAQAGVGSGTAQEFILWIRK